MSVKSKRKKAKIDLTEIERELFERLEEPEMGEQAFLDALRNTHIDSMPCISSELSDRCNAGELDDDIINVLDEMSSRSIKEMMTCNNWVERLLAARNACRVDNAETGEYVAKHSSERLISALLNYKFYNEMHLNIYISLEKQLIKIGCEDDELVTIADEFSEYHSNGILMEIIKNGMITNKSVLNLMITNPGLIEKLSKLRYEYSEMISVFSAIAGSESCDTLLCSIEDGLIEKLSELGCEDSEMISVFSAIAGSESCDTLLCSIENGLIEKLSELGYEDSELFATISAIAKSPQYAVLLRTIEDDSITEKSMLDDLLKSSLELEVKTSRRI